MGLNQGSSGWFNLDLPIATSGTETDPIDLNIKTQTSTICGVFIPDNFTGTTISFLGAVAIDGTYVPVLSAGVLYEITTLTGECYVPIENLAIIAGLQFVKIVTDAQDEDIILTVAIRPV